MKKNQRLVGVIHQLTMGGAERMMVQILNHFVSTGIEVHLILFKNIGLHKESLNPQIIIHDLNSASVTKGMGKCLWKIYKLQPNVLFSGIGHVNISLAPFIPFMKMLLPKSRWISRETNIVSLKIKKEKYPKVFNFLYKTVYQNYDVVIAQSKDMQNDLKINYPKAEKKSLVINNPVNIENIHALALKEISFSFSEEYIYLLTVGELRKTKRQDLLLEAFSKLPLNYRLIIIGTGKEEQQLKELSSHLNIATRVYFEGYQHNPFSYMAQADLFLLTSEHEGFPNVLLEANSLGTPVVAFNCQGGISEIIEEGTNGFFVPFGDVDALAVMIENAMKKNLEKESVIHSIKKRYSHDIILKKYEKVFFQKKVLNEIK